MKEDFNFLILKGCAGLGNRLFTVIEALNYCVRNNRKLYIDWSDGQFGKLNKNVFNDFFTIKHNLFVDELTIRTYLSKDCYPRIWNHNLNKNIYDLYDVGSPNCFLKKMPFFLFSKKNKKSKNQLWIKKRVNNKYGFKDIFNSDNMAFGGDLMNDLKPEIVIYADFRPGLKSEVLISKLKLKSVYEKELNSWAYNYRLSESHIGVHIRNSDKRPEKSINSLLKFLCENYANQKIFLSTDNSDIELFFKDNFKDNLLTYPKDLPEEVADRGIHMWGIDNNDDNYKAKMLKESIYDMWLLSKCKTLFYQGNSSFSLFSKLLHPFKENCHDWQEVIK